MLHTGGRVKAGAKGIGRFALDKLGERCEMYTFFNPKVHDDIYEDGKPTGFVGYHWVVNWNEFDGVNKTIDITPIAWWHLFMSWKKRNFATQN